MDEGARRGVLGVQLACMEGAFASGLQAAEAVRKRCADADPGAPGSGQ